MRINKMPVPDDIMMGQTIAKRAIKIMMKKQVGTVESILNYLKLLGVVIKSCTIAPVH